MAAKKKPGPKPPLAAARPAPPQPRYVGSPEHKIAPFSDIKPRLRSDATACPPDLDPKEAQTLLEQALANVLYEGAHPANYVYAVSTQRRMVFEGRLTNREGLQYKGWPTEWGAIPDEVRSRMLAARLVSPAQVPTLMSLEVIRDEVK